MKAKLLKRLREEGRDKITILSVTTTANYRGCFITGMQYSYTGDELILTTRQMKLEKKL